MTTIKIDDNIVSQMDLSEIFEYVKWACDFYGTNWDIRNKGEHYKLLAFISSQLKHGIIVDLGTCSGASALALAFNKEIQVITYDIFDHIEKYRHTTKTIHNVNNIQFRLANGISNMNDYISNTLVILLDVDPHDGYQELDFITLLTLHGYKGIVICDDIHLNQNMEKFWNSVKQKKIDVTTCGHSTGTGIIIFDDTIINVSYKCDSAI